MRLRIAEALDGMGGAEVREGCVPIPLGVFGVQAGQREGCPERMYGSSKPFLHVPSLTLLPRSSMPHMVHPVWKASTAQ